MSDKAQDLKTKAFVAQKSPYATKVEKGKTYYWCTCGKSKNQPFCDGSHVEYGKEVGVEFAPMAWTAEEDGEKHFCGCKKTNSAPFCDGSHTKLEEKKSTDEDAAAAKIQALHRGNKGREKAAEKKAEKEGSTGAEYLKKHGVAEALQKLIDQVVAEKPANPLKALEDALKKQLDERDAKNTNHALLFIKPHGQVAAMKSFLEDAIIAAGMIITGAGDVNGKTIDEKGMIDSHYAAIAQYAMQTSPSDLPLSDASKAEFKKTYSAEWEASCKDGKVLNLKATAEKLKMSLEAVNDKVEVAKKDKLAIKLMPGCYCAHLKEDDIFVVNGFYGPMRAQFTAEAAKVSWYTVAWDESKLSWADFRGKFLGATDVTKADKESLRGKLFADHEKYGLPFVPDTSKNCIHGSASPLEGLNERLIWLAASGATLENDPFGKALVAAGLTSDNIKKALTNPTVDGKPLFDVVEDQNAADCTKALVNAKASL